ncbi:acyltransferase family protein [Roseobacter sp. OBYS 0001]|uniref:acyltransferase family protein n=1 Tax=Roseobacter sp. OBYS 0001 TaxID=882651 RepID=UPI001BC815B4|nr:acyltransferase family protein [Roseobacter sp. OBYS 0001]GIT89295.1 acyltransferase [Roseobacter sp. OBYS 0001]
MKYRAEIDGLRAMAVVPVVLFHAGVPIFSGGFVGVDVFFVISGFLITFILIRELDAGTFSLINFYERRARRILPALFVVIAACLPFAFMLLVPQDLKDFGESVAAVALFSSNVLFWQESGYFASELKPLLHTWSLAVEEQYYILFPLFLMITWQWGKKITLALLIVVFALSLLAAQVLVTKDASFAFFMLPTRGWELLAGSFVAFALQRYPDLPGSAWLAQAGSLLGLAMVLYAIFVFDAQTPFPSLYTMVPVLGSVLIILCARQGTVVHALLCQRAFVGIGLVSYSAYLWHQPLFAFTRYANAGHPPGVIMAGLVLVTFLLAYASWRWVETPFRIARGAPEYIDRTRIFGASGAMLAGLAALGITLHLKDGLPARYSPLKQDLFASATSSPSRGRCHNVALPQDACHYNGDTPTWAIIGDSHAVELAHGLAGALQPQKKSLAHFSASGCGPRFGMDTGDPCSQWAARGMKHLLADDTIDTVVISYRIAAYLKGNHEGIYPSLPNDVDARTRTKVWEAYVAMMQALVDHGKTVHLVLQAPEVPAHINQMVRRAGPGAGAPNKLSLAGVPRAWWEARMAYVLQRLDDIPDAVHIHDPAATFCDTSHCYLSHDGRALYFDDDHISITGAALIADQIVNAPQRAAGLNPPRTDPG